MGPEADLIIQVKKALKQARAPVYYDGQAHKSSYPQIIVNLSNIQNEPHDFKDIEQTKLTITVDVYAMPERLDQLLDLSNQVRNMMEKVRCTNWWSDFDDYSCRILDDETYQGQSIKRAAFLFDYVTRGIAIKKGSN